VFPVPGSVRRQRQLRWAQLRPRVPDAGDEALPGRVYSHFRGLWWHVLEPRHAPVRRALPLQLERRLLWQSL
jgi:hypothetical protein